MTRVASSRKTWRDVNRQWLAGNTPVTDMPALPMCKAIPERLISFSDALHSKPEKNAFVHFYIDDYRQESIWTNPDRYVPRFQQFGGIISPDFSPYLDMNLYQQRFNIYRQRALGKFYAFFDIPVIPNLRIGSLDTVEDALRGIVPGSTVAISTVGAAGDEECSANHLHLLQAAVERLQLTDVLLYGRPLPGFEALPCTFHMFPAFYEKFTERRKGG